VMSGRSTRTIIANHAFLVYRSALMPAFALAFQAQHPAPQDPQPYVTQVLQRRPFTGPCFKLLG